MRSDYEAVRPTLADVDAFQRRHKLQLPPSYVDFICQVGPGVFGNYFVIDAPLSGYRGRGLNRKIKHERGNDTLAAVYRDRPFIDRMIPFGDTIGGDIFAWDPKDVARRSPLEYQIYVLPRDRSQIIPIANSFPQFIRQVCFGRRLEDFVFGRRDPEWSIEYVIEPFSRPTRRKSPTRHVKP